MMRIAIFDGILETHVVRSFERALRARGHAVFNTGKIGHGFEFANAPGHLRRLEASLDDCIAFQPDWLFVFRPASLPPSLIRKVKRRGINLAVWLSDDPVLFDLTYGPVIDDYDLVLHCGTRDVLAFYEQQFGRPTGVNVPFWTDHEAFPLVWGTEPPATDALFLGNVHDEVRRSRYFDLAGLKSSVAVYGNIGNDYYGLSCGYLDSDFEVVAAGARARIAISVPQFFANHRGLRTWFRKLDKLGYFEYPSRIIQYMAMGLPVFNVIPSKPSFESFPEMLVASDFGEVDDLYQKLDRDDALGALSAATAERFDRHFNAMSRVLLFENLVESDDWKAADLTERVNWFTQFDAQQYASSGSDDRFAVMQGKVAATRDSYLSGITLRVGITGKGWTRQTSRLATIWRSLDKNDDVELFGYNPFAVPNVYVPDPQRIVSRVLNLSGFGDSLGTLDVLIVADSDTSITDNARSRLSKLGIRTLCFLDEEVSGLKKLKRISGGFDLIATSSVSTYRLAQDLGIVNVTYTPNFVDQEFRDLVDDVAEPKAALHIRSTNSTEEAAAPAFLSDLTAPLETWESLESLDLEALAEAVTTEFTYMSFAGSSTRPVINEIAAYAAYACKWLMIPRFGGPADSFPYTPYALQVKPVGEAALKLRQLYESSLLQSYHQAHKLEDRATTLCAEWQIERVLESLLRLSEPAAPLGKASTEIRLTANEVVELPISGYVASAEANAVELEIGTRPSALPGLVLGVVQVVSNDGVLWEEHLRSLPCRIFVGWHTKSQRDRIQLRMKRHDTTGLAIGIAVDPVDGVFQAIATPPRVYVATRPSAVSSSTRSMV